MDCAQGRKVRASGTVGRKLGGSVRQATSKGALARRLLPWLLGLGYALAIAPLGLLTDSAGPLLLPAGDLSHQQGAMVAFMAEPWQWPPTHASLPRAPGGLNLFETDSVPLAGLLAKLWQSLTSDSPAVLGIWIFLSYALQPVTAAYLVRCLGARGWLPALAAGLVALSLPALHFRFGHLALQAHWVILLALALAAGSRDSERGLRRLALLGLLVWAVLWINAYLLVMVLALFGGACLDALWRGRASRRMLLLGAAPWAAGFALLYLLSGFGDVGPPAWGFGHYSMNLASPVVPQASGLWPGFAESFASVRPHKQGLETLGHPWRPLADMIDPTGGQYEGFNYLGAGLLLLILAAATAPLRLAALLAGRGGLFLACLALALLSLSNQVWLAFGHWFSLPEPPDLVAQFRSTGRFFWPLAYLLLGLAVTSAAGRGRRAAALLLVAGALLQTADAWRWHERTYRNLHHGGALAVSAEAWRPLLRVHARVTVMPPYECAGRLRHIGQDVAYLAVAAGRPVNSFNVSRPAATPCAALALALLLRGPAPGELVFLDPPLARALAIAPSPWRAACRAEGAALVCSRDATALDAAGFSALPSGHARD